MEIQNSSQVVTMCFQIEQIKQAPRPDNIFQQIDKPIKSSKADEIVNAIYKTCKQCDRKQWNRKNIYFKYICMR